MVYEVESRIRARAHVGTETRTVFARQISSTYVAELVARRTSHSALPPANG